MAGKYQAYPKYKDSQSGFLGRVPKHWSSGRLKFLVTKIVDGAHFTPTYVDTGIPFLRVTDIQEREINQRNLKFIPVEEHKELILRCKPETGDLLLSKNGTIGIPKIIDWDWEFSIFVSLCLIKPKQQLCVSYAYYHFLSHGIREQISSLIKKSTVINLHLDKIANFEIALLPIAEQQQIANFLDHETAKIDRLIEKQQQLIELLKEKRQAVISHAVTKGLNPNAPLKPSGVEWLGDVPEHWEMLKGSWIGKLFGSEAIAEEDVKSEGLIPFIKVSSLALNGFDLSDLNFYLDSTPGREFRTRSNYLVFPKRGAAIFTNKVNYVEVESIIDPNLMGWEIGPKALPEFIAHLLKLRGLDDIADVSTVPQINNKHIEPIIFPIPPKEEQVEILKHLDSRTKQIDELISKAGDAIELMQERRTALISAAVTGKIDVRNWQASEPSETEGAA